MSGADERNKALTELSQMIAGFSKITPEDLAREDDLGKEQNFKDVLPEIKIILKLFRELADCDLKSLPINIVVGIRDCGEEFFNNLNKIREFSLRSHGPNPLQIRNNIISAIKDSFEKFYLTMSPVIAYESQKDISKIAFEEKANKMLDELQSSIDINSKNIITVLHDIVNKYDKDAKDKLNNINASLKNIQEIEDKIKMAAQEVAVSAHSIHFKKEADEHKKAANIWLFVTVVIAIVAICFGIYNYDHFMEISDKITTYQNIQLIVAKVVIFSLLLTGLVWSGRIYRANRHNYIINKHRHNALNTFEAFAKSTNDEQIKAAVLLQTTQCIFSQQNSGYISQEGEMGGAPQILEIIRGIYNPPSK